MRLLSICSHLGPRRFARSSALLIAALACVRAPAADRTWIGGDADWLDGGATANWTPADEPDADDVAIFNTANGVNLGSNNSVAGLTLSGAIDLSTNGFDLAVDGLVQLTGASTNLFVGGAAGSVNADNLTINSGARVEMQGGLLTLDEESGTSLLDLNAGGTLSGNGVITFADTPILTTTLLVNDGTLTASSRAANILLAPPVGTLQINDSSLGGRVNLDGASEVGSVNVNRNQTLDLNVPMTDPFSGSMNLFHNATFDSGSAWTLDGGALTADNGAFAGIPSAPASVSFIKGGALTQTGGAIAVADNDGTLQFDVPFTMTGGSFANNGHVIFNAGATLGAGANFTMPTSNSSITVGANQTVTVDQANFNADGAASATNFLTLEDDAFLNLHLGVGADTSLGCQIALKGGTLAATTSQGSWSIDGDISVPAGFSASTINGHPLTLSAVTANVGGALNIVPSVTFGLGVAFSGAGQLVFSGPVNVSNATAINMPAGIVDLDGADGVGDFINIDAPLVINAGTVSSFGKLNGGGGVNTLDIDARTPGTSGSLTVNLDNPNGNWALNSTGVMNLLAPNGGATLLSGNDAVLNGVVNVTGASRIGARIQLGGAININAGSTLTLDGGTDLSPNRLNGGIINGPGGFFLDGPMTGFGTLNGPVVIGSILADDGEIFSLNSEFIFGSRIGTADDDGVLTVANDWNTASVVVRLNGGVLQGGTATVFSNGINGHGLISAKLINETRITADVPGKTLICQTAASDNDWDGAGGLGELIANQGTLDLRDIATFGFTGKVTAVGGGRVFANNFALDFNPGSTLTLAQGTYEASSSTDLGGAVAVAAGSPSTLIVQDNRFLTFEPTCTTTLNGNLLLDNNNIGIRSGASFAGNGGLVVLPGSHLVMEAGANANVLLENQGTLRPAGFTTVGRVDARDYVQDASGRLVTEIGGAALNEYDRLVVNGTAILGGHLELRILNGFVPNIGQTFNLLSASGGVIGTFDSLSTNAMPPGKTLRINYLPNLVQAEVIPGDSFELWINNFPSLTDPADRLKTADPDRDGRTNFAEFAFDGDPTDPASDGKIVGKIAPVGGVEVFTLTFPIRNGTAFPGNDPPGGELLLQGLTIPPTNYVIQATDTLISYPLDVTRVTGADATAIQAGLPPLSAPYSYETCRSPGPVAGDPGEFMRVGAYESP